MTIIENDYLRVAIDTKGAQLTSVYDKIAGRELLWQADPAIWGYHAPNLFPVVGGLINDQLLVDGKSFKLNRHGFARQSEFLVVDNDHKQAKFSLPYSDATLESYPYKFDFQVNYDLIDNALRVTYKVINQEEKKIYFSVGGHPAFNVPFNEGENYEDYYLEFELEEKLESHLLSSEGFFTGEMEPVNLDGKKLRLTKDLFAKDALVFKAFKSREVCIKSDKHDQSVSVEFPHFNYLGVWAKSGADFLCIEPWLGCADTANKHVDISHKEDIQHLKKGHVFEESFFISV
jgi:galactose mutarotase-like enzyme